MLGVAPAEGRWGATLAQADLAASQLAWETPGGGVDMSWWRPAPP